MASPPSELAGLIDMNGTMGAAFIGMVASAMLWGVSNLQLYIYYRQFPNDWILYRVSVAFVWLLDTLNLALTIHAVYYYLIVQFGQYIELTFVVWSFKLQTATNVVIIVMVQALYSVRLWKLNRRKTLLPRLVPLIVAIGAAVGIALAVKTYELEKFQDIDKMAWAAYASFAVVAMVDFAIAGAMCYYLRGSRSEFQATNSRLSALILWTLSTGLVTSVCSVICIIAFAAMPHNLVFVAIEFLLTKLYLNSFLAMLNARITIRDKGTEEHSSNYSNARSPHTATPRVPFSHEETKHSVPLEDMSDQRRSVIRVQSPFVSIHHSKADRDSDDESTDRKGDAAHAV